MEKSRHLIFSDESGWESANRYGSIALISGSYSDTKSLNEELTNVLQEKGKKEIKFKEIKNKRNQTIASVFFKIGFKYLIQARIKVHILVWDKQDSRHKIQGRDDIKNLIRMYYHSLKVLKKHWNIQTNWEFYPDEFTAIDWYDDVIKYIENTNLRGENYQPGFFETFDDIRFPRVTNTKELESQKYGVIQLADLYAGIIRTSRSESKDFYKWYNAEKNKNQPTLFSFDEDEVNISKTLLYKFEAMLDFKQQADKYKMGLNLSKNQYFQTFNRKNNWQIWHYEPQGEYDKAPSKRKN